MEFFVCVCEKCGLYQSLIFNRQILMETLIEHSFPDSLIKIPYLSRLPKLFRPGSMIVFKSNNFAKNIFISEPTTACWWCCRWSWISKISKSHVATIDDLVKYIRSETRWRLLDEMMYPRVHAPCYLQPRHSICKAHIESFEPIGVHYFSMIT